MVDGKWWCMAELVDATDAINPQARKSVGNSGSFPGNDRLLKAAVTHGHGGGQQQSNEGKCMLMMVDGS